MISPESAQSSSRTNGKWQGKPDDEYVTKPDHNITQWDKAKKVRLIDGNSCGLTVLNLVQKEKDKAKYKIGMGTWLNK